MKNKKPSINVKYLKSDNGEFAILFKDTDKPMADALNVWIGGKYEIMPISEVLEATEMTYEECYWDIHQKVSKVYWDYDLNVLNQPIKKDTVIYEFENQIFEFTQNELIEILSLVLLKQNVTSITATERDNLESILNQF